MKGKTMKTHVHILVLCLGLTAGLVLIQDAGAQIPEEVNAGDIAISLSLQYSPMSRIGRGRPLSEEIPPYFAPMVVIWEDGRILFGEYGEWDKEKLDWTWTYSRGKIDREVIDSLQKKVSDSYRLGKKNVHAWCYGPDASTFLLRTKFDGGYFTVNTWEEFNITRIERWRIIIGAKDTKDGKPVYLPEFYDIWKEVKKHILTTAGQAVAKNAVPVDVIVEGYVLCVKDKDGKTLLQQDFSEHFHPKEEKAEKPKP